MNAHTLNGVRVGGTPDRPSLINQSDKPIIGYAVQRVTDIGVNPVLSVVLFGWVAAGKAIQPGEEQTLGLVAFHSRGLDGTERPKSTTLRYDLKAVLFADGEFQGDNDEAFQDFSQKVSTVRTLALDAQYDQNKYQTLAQYNIAALLEGLRNASPDVFAIEAKTAAATIILEIHDQNGEQEGNAAIERLAALPGITKGGNQ
jgi:hypothetical protein